MDKNDYITVIKRRNIIFLCILAWLLIIAIITLTTALIEENRKLNEITEFEPIKEGICVYVEYPNSYTGDIPIPNYLLVYDYETDKIIEVDVFDEVVYVRINVGDTILYCVDYNYTDADFLNVIKES